MSDSFEDLIAGLFEDMPPAGLPDYVAYECERYGISGRQLSEAIGIGRRSLQRILEGEAQKIDGFLIYKLAEFFGVSVDELLRRAVATDPERVEEALSARRYGFIARNFDLKGLRKIGFIESSTDFAAIEQRIKGFFGYGSVFEYDKELPGTAFRHARRNASDEMQRFWMSFVHAQFKELAADAPRYDRAKLIELLPQIKPYTLDYVNGFGAFVHELYECGVLVIVETYVYNSAVYGATVEVGDRPCIVLTNRENRYDLLWRTLAHELCHVLKDLDAIRDRGYHITSKDAPELFDTEEQRANTFSNDLFLSPPKRRELTSVIDSEYAVKVKSAAWRVHPALAYGLYLDVELADAPAEYRSDQYAKYRRDGLPSALPAIQHHFTNLSTPVWTRNTLAETGPLLRKALKPNAKP